MSRDLSEFGAILGKDATVALNSAYDAGVPELTISKVYRTSGEGLVIDQNRPFNLIGKPGHKLLPDPDSAQPIKVASPISGDGVEKVNITGLRVAHSPGSEATTLVLENASRVTITDLDYVGGQVGIIQRNVGRGDGKPAFSENNRFDVISARAVSVDHIRIEVGPGGDSSFENTLWTHVRTTPRAGVFQSMGLNIGRGASMAAVTMLGWKADAMGASTCFITDGNLGGWRFQGQAEGLRGAGNVVWGLGPNIAGQAPAKYPNWSGSAYVELDVIGKAWATDRFPRPSGVLPLHVAARPTVAVA